MSRRVLLSWSSGKDAAWTLRILRQEPKTEVVGFLTTFNEAVDRVAMHAVRRSLVEAQAAAAGVPLWPVTLPWPCSNEEYERRMARALTKARDAGVTHVAFGDLYLEDIRDYRVRQLEGTGIKPIFPLWRKREQAARLPQEMIRAGLQAVVTCIDPKRVPQSLIGRRYDAGFLADLPKGVDPCGERGEFHTFCYAGPMFEREISIALGEIVHKDGFCFADVTLA